jgi:hypothetical protein
MEPPLQHGNAKYTKRSPGQSVCGVVKAQVNAADADNDRPNERQIPEFCV